MTETLRTTARVSAELQHEVEQFLYTEAALLDDRDLEGWLTLLAPDVTYFMPVRSSRQRREIAQEWSGPGDLSHFDETYDLLRQRVRRLGLSTAWSEDPPSRTRRLVTNVRVRPAEAEGEYDVESNILIYRTRLEREQDLFAGQRTDLLRRSETGLGWQIARRTILLDQATILGKNLNLFF